MSAEQLAAARKAGEDISDEDRAKWKRFHERLGAVRTLNMDLSDGQRQLRLQGKGSRGTVHKSRLDALQITVLLIIMREMKGLPLTYIAPEVRCRDKRCDSVIKPARERLIHNVRDENLDTARALRKRFKVLLDLHEFIEEYEDK